MKKPSQTGIARLSLIFVMLIFGTIGIFRRAIPLPSGTVAFVRGFVGAVFLLILMGIRSLRGHGTAPKTDTAAIRRCFLPLALSGALMGFNWILLFEAYNYTTVSKATLCYYLAPMLVMLASPVLFAERLTIRKWCCIGAAFVGMVCVSGILSPSGGDGENAMRGILFGLAAAVFYAAIVLINKKTGDALPAFEKTQLQLSVAAVVLLPYSIFAEDALHAVLPLLNGKTVFLLLFVGIVHTGFAYALYFHSVGYLSAQTTAILSYLDPVFTILLSTLFLKDPLTPENTVGAVLILGAALVSELPAKNKKAD